jgi:predicted enzyme related to lactoylglutathione lyase
MTRFCRVQLRTTDVAAARAFYARVLGDGVAPDVAVLPDDAVARGARPHWLGHIGVDDVEAVARAFVERGATRLGPTRPLDGGGQIAILRDPGAAVVALATPPPALPRNHVVWCLLNTADFARASAAYCQLLGWQLTDRLDLGALGVYHHFAWSAGEANAGAMSDIAGRPGVHPHWLFHFRVPVLDAALDVVRAQGGLVIGPFRAPSGERIAVCDDPQGGAFALRE